MKELTLTEVLETVFKEKETVEIKDVMYFNNSTEKVVIEVFPGDEKEYLESIVLERQRNLPEFISRVPREITTMNNAVIALEKAKDYGTIIKKLKTLTKYSADRDFKYRTVADILKNLEFYQEYHPSEEDEMNDDSLSKFIVTQTIESLEKHGMIHPKLKLLMNLVGKLDSLEEETVQSEEGFLTFSE